MSAKIKWFILLLLQNTPAYHINQSSKNQEATLSLSLSLLSSQGSQLLYDASRPRLLDSKTTTPWAQARGSNPKFVWGSGLALVCCLHSQCLQPAPRESVDDACESWGRQKSICFIWCVFFLCVLKALRWLEKFRGSWFCFTFFFFFEWEAAKPRNGWVGSSERSVPSFWHHLWEGVIWLETKNNGKALEKIIHLFWAMIISFGSFAVGNWIWFEFGSGWRNLCAGKDLLKMLVWIIMIMFLVVFFLRDFKMPLFKCNEI